MCISDFSCFRPWRRSCILMFPMRLPYAFLFLTAEPVLGVILAVFVAVLAALGIWERVVRSRARSWPVAQATIDSALVQKYSRKGERWIARLNYSFQVPAGRRTGRYSRKFSYEGDAEDFVRDLQGKPLLVHYSTRWPISMALDEDVEMLLQTRSAQPPATEAIGTPPAPVPILKKFIAYLMMPVALAGFLLSLYIHIAAWLGHIVLEHSWIAWLHVGIFVPFITALVLSPKDSPRRRRVDHSSPLLGKAMLAVLIYALLNFIVFVVHMATSHGTDSQLWQWRGFSGHWMLFYFWSFGFLYDVVRPNSNRAR
jgi:hypothetical protein